jgi:hypothetical protein
VKKFIAMLFLGAFLVAGLGCGDDKKPAAKDKDTKPGAGKTDGDKKTP